MSDQEVRVNDDSEARKDEHILHDLEEAEDASIIGHLDLSHISFEWL